MRAFGSSAEPHVGTDMVKQPDRMGFGYEDGTVWYPRSDYPTRDGARRAYMDWTGLTWKEVSVLSRWACFDAEMSKTQGESWWRECPRDTPGAFQVWRCE